METAANLNRGPVLSRTVLVVDNTRTVRSITHCLLTTGSSEVMEAADSNEALNLLSKGRRPDLILVGDDLPGTSGVDLVRKIRETDEFRYTPIVMLAGENRLHRQMIWKEAGATCWIIKPFTGDQLLQVVDLVMF